MKRFSQFVVSEAVTAAATNTEMAICYHYNLKRTKDQKKALSDSGISDDNFKKLTPDLLKIGEKVASQMGDRGPMLIHSGASTANKNYYEGASDKTPKADFFGNSDNYISLKKAGDSGAGAQLMSAKSAEAAGVVKAAVGHLENVSKTSISKNKDFKRAVSILENEMKATARNDLNIEVGKGKKSFEDWYISSSSRRDDVLKKERNVKKAEKHLKAELALVGASKMFRTATKNLIDGITPLTKAELPKYYTEYEKDKSYKVGDVTVSARHLEKVAKEELTDPALKKQITDVIETSVNSQEWQNTLTKFFTDNEELKQYMVYEAGSGLYKFTGQYTNGTNYFGSNQNVANKILVFSNDGIKSEYDMMKYAKDNTSLVNNISISYKGAGRSKYIKLGIASSIEHELPMLHEEIEQLQEQYYLNEGIFSNLKNKAKAFMDSLKKLVMKFYDKIILKIIGNIKSLAEKGVTVLLDALGLEFEGSVKMDTPKW